MDIIDFINDLNASGKLEYNDYSQLHDLASDLEAENNALKERLSKSIKEFAEKLKTGLFAHCVIIKTIHNPQEEDMISNEVFQTINDLAEQYGREETK